MEQLDAVSYNKIGSNQEEIGLIAEDVAELFPEVVKYDNEGRPDGVNYSRLSVILLKAVQELTERVNKLENK
jgi:autotransporter adhesin